MTWPQTPHPVSCAVLCSPGTALIQCEKRSRKAMDISRQKPSRIGWEAGHHMYFAFEICPSLSPKFSKSSPTFNTQIKAYPFHEVWPDSSATIIPIVTLMVLTTHMALIL